MTYKEYRDEELAEYGHNDTSPELFRAAAYRMRLFEREGGVVDDEYAFIDAEISALVNDERSRFYIYG
jgi:hypothetical protein